MKEEVKLPKPEFYTFYNGTSKMEAERTLYLSDAYKIKDGDPMLELKVRVININFAAHHEILEKCQVLKEYSMFIDTIRKYQTLGTEDPYEHAIKECIEKGILAEYLERKGSEVVNMLVAEYDYNMDIEVQREEAMEDGIQIGEVANAVVTVKNLIRDFKFTLEQACSAANISVEDYKKNVENNKVIL